MDAKNYELGVKTYLMERYEALEGATLDHKCFTELSGLEFEMAMRMRVLERHQYVAATHIQAAWKGFQTRKEVIPQIRAYMRGVVYITTFLRGKIDRLRMRIKKREASTLL